MKKKYNKNINIYKTLFILISILILLRPHFNFTNSILTVYMFDIIIIGIISFSLLIIKIHIKQKHKVLLSISFLVVFMLLIPVIINSLKSIPKLDIWLAYMKILYYIITFWFLYFLLTKIPEGLSLLNKILNITFFIIFVISIIQLLDPPMLGDAVKLLYGSEKLRSIWNGYPRVFGTFYNANWFGVYLVFYLSWLNSNFLSQKIPMRKFVLRLILLIILIIISGSRTAMIGALVSLIFQLYGYRHKKTNILLLFIGVFLVVTVNSLMGRVDLLDKTIERFSSTIEIFKTKSFSISDLNPGRWNSWVKSYNMFKTSPFFGTGYMGHFIPHNSYLYFLNMFGLFGITIMGLVFSMLNYFYKKIFNNSCRDKVMYQWRMGFIPAFLVMSLTAEFFFTTQVMLLVILVCITKLFPRETKI